MYLEDVATLLRLAVSLHDPQQRQRIEAHLERERQLLEAPIYLLKPQAGAWLIGPKSSARHFFTDLQGVAILYAAIAAAPRPVDGLSFVSPGSQAKAVSNAVKRARNWITEIQPTMTELLQQVRVAGDGSVEFIADEYLGSIET
jgi:hypothetical protein